MCGALLGGLLLASLPSGSEALADSCHVLSGVDDRCEAWDVVADRGENCCSWVLGFHAAKRFLASGDRLFLTMPMNDPGQPVLEERYDFQTSSFSASDGDLLWKSRYGGPDWDIPLSLTESPDGSRVYATGYRDYPTTPNSIGSSCGEAFTAASAMTIAHDAQTGQELWRSGFSEPSFLDAAFNAVLSPDGRILYQAGIRLAGDPENCDFDAAVAALDTETGLELWGAMIAGGTIQGTWRFDYASGIAITPGGKRLLVSGSARNAGTLDDMFVAAVNVDDDPDGPHRPGEVMWRTDYDEIGGSDVMQAMAFDAEHGRVFVTGVSFEPQTLTSGYGPGCVSGCWPYHFATAAYDAATGAEIWRTSYVGPAVHKHQDEPFAISVSPDGDRVFVTGESAGTHDFDWDYATVAYDGASGEELWVARDGLPTGLSSGRDNMVSPDGSLVYVTGAANDVVGVPAEAGTLAYDASSGRQLWVARYGAPLEDDTAVAGEQMALSPDGERLFVSGVQGPRRTGDLTISGDSDQHAVLLAYDL